MTDITQLVQTAARALEKVVSENTVGPILDSLKDIKSVYETSGMKSPVDFAVAKALREVSDGTITGWIYKEDQGSLALNFSNREDKDQILDIARSDFKKTTVLRENETYYIDSKNYVIGILVDHSK